MYLQRTASIFVLALSMSGCANLEKRFTLPVSEINRIAEETNIPVWKTGVSRRGPPNNWSLILYSSPADIHEKFCAARALRLEVYRYPDDQPEYTFTTIPWDTTLSSKVFAARPCETSSASDFRDMDQGLESQDIEKALDLTGELLRQIAERNISLPLRHQGDAALGDLRGLTLNDVQDIRRMSYGDGKTGYRIGLRALESMRARGGIHFPVLNLIYLEGALSEIVADIEELIITM